LRSFGKLWLNPLIPKCHDYVSPKTLQNYLVLSKEEKNGKNEALITYPIVLYYIKLVLECEGKFP